MPVPQLKVISSKTGVSISNLERYWEEAKKQVDKKFESRNEDYWKMVYGIVLNRAHNKRVQLAKKHKTTSAIVLATSDKQFQSILKLSADTPAQLRPCDVDRVLEAAEDQHCLDKFKTWLLAQKGLQERTIKNIKDFE